MRIDRDAAAVVADGDRVILVQLDLDPGGMAGDGLVHRVVEDLGDEVVQRAFIGAADIHAGAFADGFQPLQHLDGAGVIGVGGGVAGEEVIGHRVLDSCSVPWTGIRPFRAGLRNMLGQAGKIARVIATPAQAVRAVRQVPQSVSMATITGDQAPRVA